MDRTLNQCSVCNCDYTDDEGGIDGHFGMLPVSFCPTCFSCMCDMAGQFTDQEHPEHDELMQHLRGVRHIVINETYGGFDLSRAAELLYLERTGTAYELRDREDRASTVANGPHIYVNGNLWHARDIDRDDPALVDLVREMGVRAGGQHGHLKVVTIPADVDWIIQDYDGQEWVAEKHRIWK